MTDPSLDRAALAVGDLSASVRTLTSEVIASESLRTDKIRWMQRLLYVLVPAVVLLVIMAISNFVLLNRINSTAADARDTNQLLVGCFQPHTRCSDASKAEALARANQSRQTTYVILVCLRLNPLDKDPDAIGVQKCVQQYYPGFTLPKKAVG